MGHPVLGQSQNLAIKRITRNYWNCQFNNITNTTRSPSYWILFPYFTPYHSGTYFWNLWLFVTSYMKLLALLFSHGCIATSVFFFSMSPDQFESRESGEACLHWAPNRNGMQLDTPRSNSDRVGLDLALTLGSTFNLTCQAKISLDAKFGKKIAMVLKFCSMILPALFG